MERSVMWTPRVDFDHLVSVEQIEYAGIYISEGDWIEFTDDTDISGRVLKKYPKGFLLDCNLGTRYFTYKQLILGNNVIRKAANIAFPITDTVKFDHLINPYSYCMTRF